MGTLVADLTPSGGELRQTHISWVFLDERQVVKVKKPVDFGFLDFSTPAAREAMCRAEVAVNRRLSPDVYLGVEPVTLGPDGVHRLGGTGPVVDWAVRMRRLPDHHRADLRLAAGTLTDAHLARVAAEIAAFHSACETGDAIETFGTPEAVGRNVRENFDQTRGTVHRFLSQAEATEVERWQLGYLAGQAGRFADRIAAGRVRDGHGDLRLEHLYFDDAGDLRVVDAIEFNERFRYGDTAADVAFLTMDLRFHGRSDLAERFAALYARAAEDYDLYPMLDFYESYRAWVRGKVATLVAQDTGVDEAGRARAAGQAQRFFKLALAADRKPALPPVLVAVGGLIASGKSTMADALSRLMGAPVVDSDRTRKHLAGVAPTTRLGDGSWTGAYDPRFTERVYDEVFRRAAVVLGTGRSAIVDASFRSVAMRRRARATAAAAGVPLRVVECRVERATAMARLAERERQPETVSDGRREVYDAFASRWEPMTELSPEQHVLLDTSRPVEACLAELRRRIPTWPSGLAG